MSMTALIVMAERVNYYILQLSDMTSLHSITHGQIDGDGPNFIVPLCKLKFYKYAYLNVQCIYLKTLRNII